MTLINDCKDIVLVQNDVYRYVQKSDYSYKLLIVNCYDNVYDVKEIMTDYLNEPLVYNIGADLVILYDSNFDVSDLELTDIVLSIRENLDSRIKMVKCGVINKYNYSVLCDIYKGYKYICDRNFTFNNLSDLVVFLADKDLDIIRNIKEKVLNKIISDNQLVKLILSMFDNDLNVTKTASSMYMHRNTINNKLDFIKKETGFNVQCFKDAMALYIMIKNV